MNKCMEQLLPCLSATLASKHVRFLAGATASGEAEAGDDDVEEDRGLPVQLMYQRDYWEWDWSAMTVTRVAKLPIARM